MRACSSRRPTCSCGPTTPAWIRSPMALTRRRAARRRRHRLREFPDPARHQLRRAVGLLIMRHLSFTLLNNKQMKRIGSALVLGVLGLTASCKDFLDVNTNPNAPEAVSANLYLSPMEHWMVTAPQYDGRFIGRYAQEWYLANAQTAISTWDRMGYDPGSDNGAEQWRDVYWSLGQNLVDMINKAEAEQRWDIVGVGNFMK